MATLDSILRQGYFPRELPPTFNTNSFASYVAGHGPEWTINEWTRCVNHNVARPGGLRRPLRIPNPVSHLELARAVASNWQMIRSHTWAERLSASRPSIIAASGRAIVTRYRYAELARLKALRRRSAHYLLTADIGQFYPSIYTHTISWALESKKAAKAALRGPKGKNPNLKLALGQRLDKALQNLNEGQTQGIPIGPDSSLVVAEIILAAVDSNLLSHFGSDLHGFRFVDDYELCFQNLSLAEAALSELQSILAHYELTLNPRKTRIVELPHEFDLGWTNELKIFQIRSPIQPQGQRNDLLAYFGRAFQLASTYPTESVIKFAVANIQSLDVAPAAWRTFHNCIFGAATADASCLPVALGSLFNVSRRGGHAMPIAPLSEALESIIGRHAPRAQSSEVAWALWAALAWKVPLDSAAATLVSSIEDDIVALLALHADFKGLFPKGTLNKHRWAEMVKEVDCLKGEHWLLAYEANQQGWLRTPSVSKSPQFGPLSKAKVSFYDRNQAKPLFPEAGRSVPGGFMSPFYA